MKLTIYKKMMLGFAAIIAIMIIASTYILLELNTVSDVAKVILTSNVQSVNLAEELQTILYDENQYAQKYLISRDKTYFSLFVETMGFRIFRNSFFFMIIPFAVAPSQHNLCGPGKDLPD